MKTSIEKAGGNYKVIFTHGVQTFTLDYNGTKKECQWYKDRLDECFKRYASQQQPSREKIKFSDIQMSIINSPIHLEEAEVISLAEFLCEDLSELSEGEEEINLVCMVCGKGFKGSPPKMCCNGTDCGCLGLPIDPVVCSQKCNDTVMNKQPQPEQDELKTLINNAIEGWLARQRFNAKNSIDLKNRIWRILYKCDFYTTPSEQKPTDEDDSLDEWWRELTKRQIDYLLLKIR